MDKDAVAVFCIEGTANYRIHTKQITSKASKLAESLGSKVIICYIGGGDKLFFDELGKCGADIIEFYCCEENVKVCADIMCEWGEMLFKKYNFKVVLFMAEECGKRVAAVLSARLECGLTADCIDIKYEDQNIIFSRTALNDAVVVNIRCINKLFQITTVREGVFTVEIRNTEKNADIIINKMSVSRRKGNVEIIEERRFEAVSKVDLNNAKIVFGIGRGACDEKVLSRIKNIAKKCNAELVGSRPIIENNILDKDRQVGQSGRSIAPDLYIAFGISGVSQHIVGIKKSKIIAAVNKEKNAPIFQFADYALVADVNDILDILEKKLL